MIDSHVYAVILAGGSGTRFWPKSRHLNPKQLCAIGRADKTMLEVTLDRLDGLIPPERRMIVTHRDQAEKTAAIAGAACPRLLAEPDARNTANALALAALDIQARHQGDKPAIMVSLHADHVIRDEAAFRRVLDEAIDVAEHDLLALLGIVARHPETGYGYIEKGDKLPFAKYPGFRVKSFREKPDRDTATSYVRSGKFFWNCGIFVWRVEKLLSELHRFLPNAVDQLAPLTGLDGFEGTDPKLLASVYAKLPKIAIDNAVLEVSDAVAMVEADIGWQDVGSWDALRQCFATDKDGNVITGDVMAIDCKDTTVDTDGPLVATLGLKNMVVVAAKGAVLVCPEDRAQDVKKFVELLKEGRRDNFL